MDSVTDNLCLKNKINQILYVCILLLLFVFFAKLYNELIITAYNYNLFDEIIGGNKINITTNRLLLFIVILICIFGGLSPIIFKNFTCDNNNLWSVVFDGVYTPNETKNILCTGIKCNNIDNIIINSYRIYNNTETIITFKSALNLYTLNLNTSNIKSIKIYDSVQILPEIIVNDNVLNIIGVSEFGNSQNNEILSPLYVYNLEFYNPGPGSEKFLEQYYFGKLPAPLGSHPLYDPSTGTFNGLPNAIVSVESDLIPTPSGIELKTEPVDGLPGFYYLLIKSSLCQDRFIPLYTQQSEQFGEPFNILYYSQLDQYGNPLSGLDSMIGCNEMDYSCMCQGNGSWEPNKSRYI